MHLLKIVLYKIKAFGGSIKKILQQKKRLFTPKFWTSQLITCQFFFLYSLKIEEIGNCWSRQDT